MSNFWLRVKVWTKVTVIVAIALYALIFVSKNYDQPVNLWIFYNRTYHGSVLTLVLLCFGVGVIGTLLAGTTLRTIRQVRDLREKGRVIRMERELAGQRSKAARLQTREEPAATMSSPSRSQEEL